MKAIWNKRTIAKSEDVVIVEGTCYFPLSSINKKFFTESKTRSTCPWKGQAAYFHIEVDGQILEDAAWYYWGDQNTPDLLVGRIAFWKGVEVIGEKSLIPTKLPALRNLIGSLF